MFGDEPCTRMTEIHRASEYKKYENIVGSLCMHRPIAHLCKYTGFFDGTFYPEQGIRVDLLLFSLFVLPRFVQIYYLSWTEKTVPSNAYREILVLLAFPSSIRCLRTKTTTTKTKMPFFMFYFMAKRTPSFVYSWIGVQWTEHNIWSQIQNTVFYSRSLSYLFWHISIFIYYCLHYILIPFSAIAKCMVFVITACSVFGLGVSSFVLDCCCFFAARYLIFVRFFFLFISPLIFFFAPAFWLFSEKFAFFAATVRLNKLLKVYYMLLLAGILLLSFVILSLHRELFFFKSLLLPTDLYWLIHYWL